MNLNKSFNILPKLSMTEIKSHNIRLSMMQLKKPVNSYAPWESFYSFWTWFFYTFTWKIIMPWNRLPDVEICCGCVPDLKTAAAIIAVLGIVTSPAVSWAVVRHSYMIRVSCLITSNQARPDVVDVNINNMLSFGFGANAGLGPSCLSSNSKSKDQGNNTEALNVIFQAGTFPLKSSKSQTNSNLVKAVQYIGWIVLVSDVIFVICSIYFLLKIFNDPDLISVKVFIIMALITMFLSFIYSLVYVTACMVRGGAFPVFEFIFAFFDVFIWAYFLLVVNSYRRSSLSQTR